MFLFMTIVHNHSTSFYMEFSLVIYFMITKQSMNTNHRVYSKAQKDSAEKQNKVCHNPYHFDRANVY